jgi:transposase
MSGLSYVVELLGQYSNPDIVTRLERILAGQGRDRSSGRIVRSPRRRQRKLDQEAVEALISARTNGAEIDDLAERFGIGRNTVMAHLEREGVPGRRWPGRTLNPEQLEAAGQLYRTGLNLIAVGEEFDVDRRYLRKALPAAGFTLRKPGQQKRQTGSD